MLFRSLALLAVLVGLAGGSTAIAHVPIPVQEQIEIFRAMLSAQQQALIRELQRNLPPAQRQASIKMRESFPRGALDEQFQRLLQERFSAEDWLVVEFTRRKGAGNGLRAHPLTGLDDIDRRRREGNPCQLDSSGRLLFRRP